MLITFNKICLVLTYNAEWCAASGEKKGRWAAGWGVPLPEPFPSPPISPCSLRRPPPFRCERSERRNPLHPWQDLAVANGYSPAFASCDGSERWPLPRYSTM